MPGSAGHAVAVGKGGPALRGWEVDVSTWSKVTVLILVCCVSASAQWTNVPQSTVPRTADGKPNLSAPAPRLPDGKPDLSGIWNPPTGYVRNLMKDSKEEAPFQPWAKALYDERAAG